MSALPPRYAMGIKPPGLKTANDISRTHFRSSPGLYRKQVAEPQRRKHAGASYRGLHLSECLKDLQKKLALSLLNKIGAHSGALHSSWALAQKLERLEGNVVDRGS